MNELIKLNIAKKALAEAKTLQEIKEIKDIAIAAKKYAEAKGLGREMINDASEIEIRAIRELGKLIQQKQEAGELRKQNDGRRVSTTMELTDVGVTKKESSTSKNISSIPEEKFENIINEAIQNKKPLTKTLVLREASNTIANKNIDIPNGIYKIIYADPPWKYSDTKQYRPDGAAVNHYPVMDINELCEMELPKTEINAVLFIWVTSPFLEDSFKVINAWGFKYKTSFVWDKIGHNMGHYNSVRHEFLLVCTKGSCKPENKRLFDSVQSVEKTKHSEKPQIFREIIDTLYPSGNRIELFARNKIEGWDAYGNEL